MCLLLVVFSFCMEFQVPHQDLSILKLKYKYLELY